MPIYVLELKRWAGEAAHWRGLKQLADYLDGRGWAGAIWWFLTLVKSGTAAGVKTGRRLTGRTS